VRARVFECRVGPFLCVEGINELRKKKREAFHLSGIQQVSSSVFLLLLLLCCDVIRPPRGKQLLEFSFRKLKNGGIVC